MRVQLGQQAAERRIPELRPAAADRALSIAIRHLNAPLHTPIAAERALEWLHDRSWTAEELPHARAFLDETDDHTLLDLVLAGAVTYDQLAACADILLPSFHATRLWLHEMSDG